MSAICSGKNLFNGSYASYELDKISQNGFDTFSERIIVQCQKSPLKLFGIFTDGRYTLNIAKYVFALYIKKKTAFHIFNLRFVTQAFVQYFATEKPK